MPHIRTPRVNEYLTESVLKLLVWNNLKRVSPLGSTSDIDSVFGHSPAFSAPSLDAFHGFNFIVWVSQNKFDFPAYSIFSEVSRLLLSPSRKHDPISRLNGHSSHDWPMSLFLIIKSDLLIFAITQID